MFEILIVVPSNPGALSAHRKYGRSCYCRPRHQERAVAATTAPTGRAQALPSSRDEADEEGRRTRPAACNSLMRTAHDLGGLCWNARFHDR